VLAESCLLINTYFCHNLLSFIFELQQLQQLQQREQSQTCLSYAERQQLSTKSTLQRYLFFFINIDWRAFRES
jgi:hypothetical protein